MTEDELKIIYQRNANDKGYHEFINFINTKASFLLDSKEDNLTILDSFYKANTNSIEILSMIIEKIDNHPDYKSIKKELIIASLIYCSQSKDSNSELTRIDSILKSPFIDRLLEINCNEETLQKFLILLFRIEHNNANHIQAYGRLITNLFYDVNNKDNYITIARLDNSITNQEFVNYFFCLTLLTSEHINYHIKLLMQFCIDHIHDRNLKDTIKTLISINYLARSTKLLNFAMSNYKEKGLLERIKQTCAKLDDQYVAPDVAFDKAHNDQEVLQIIEIVDYFSDTLFFNNLIFGYFNNEDMTLQEIQFKAYCYKRLERELSEEDSIYITSLFMMKYADETEFDNLLYAFNALKATFSTEDSLEYLKIISDNNLLKDKTDIDNFSKVINELPPTISINNMIYILKYITNKNIDSSTRNAKLTQVIDLTNNIASFGRVISKDTTNILLNLLIDENTLDLKVKNMNGLLKIIKNIAKKDLKTINTLIPKIVRALTHSQENITYLLEHENTLDKITSTMNLTSLSINNYYKDQFNDFIVNQYIAFAKEGIDISPYINELISTTKSTTTVLDTFDQADKSNIINSLKFSILSSKIIYGSNSEELKSIANKTYQRLQTSNSKEQDLEKIKLIFLENNLPYFAKLFSTYKGNKVLNRVFSPTLNNSDHGIYLIENISDLVLCSDLFKITLESNNQEMYSYLDNLEYASDILYQIYKGLDYDALNDEEKIRFQKGCNQIIALYNISNLENKETLDLTKPSPGTVKKLFNALKIKDNSKITSHSIADRMIKMYGFYCGINDLKTAKEILVKSKESATETNTDLSNNGELILKKNDLIKGVGDIQYIDDILEHGCRSGEFLGRNYHSDSTPLDTDFFKVLKNTKVQNYFLNPDEGNKIAGYGPIFLVLKNSDDLMYVNANYKKRVHDKIEVFKTSRVDTERHYGIRTGFGSTHINCFISGYHDQALINKLKFCIAKHGFYIPIYDVLGELLFSKQDFDKLKDKMLGCSYYNNSNYEFSPYLDSVKTLNLEHLRTEIDGTKKQISKIIERILSKYGITIDNSRYSSYKLNGAQLIDIGATSRYTALDSNTKYSYLLNLNTTLLLNEPIKQEILETINKEVFKNEEDRFELLIQNKTLDNYYSDDFLADKLETIKKISEQKYEQVIANIIYAKKFFIEHNLVKNSFIDDTHFEEGIEAWILENGGSFAGAIHSFLEVAKQNPDYIRFCHKYPLFNFGKNHIEDEEGFDEFRYDNYTKDFLNSDDYDLSIQILEKEFNRLISFKHHQ